MRQIILSGQEARDQLLKGINLAAQTVAVTLGPSGHNVFINPLHGYLRSTKDGISVINEISPDNPLLHAGVKVVRAASAKTADEAGDSTTSTAILAANMCNDANELLKIGKSATELRKGIEKAVVKAVAWIKENSVPINGDIEKIRAVASIAANNNELIGNLIAEAFTKIGEDGVITLEDSKTDKSEIEILGGLAFDRGMISPYFITDEVKRTCEFNDPYILLYDKRITKIVDLLAVLEISIRDQKPLLIISASCEGEALGTLVANKMQKGLAVCVVYAPEQGIKRKEVMDDISIFTGGQVISEEQGTSLDKENFKRAYLGIAQKVIIKSNSCVIINGQGDPDLSEARQKQIKEMIPEAVNDQEKEYLRKRAGSIGKGVAILSIGAATELERGDLKDLAEDAILATRSAIEEGFLPGGGVSLIRCAGANITLDENENILFKSLFQPLRQILKNAGVLDIEECIKDVCNGRDDFGYNAKTENFENLIAAGVIDAAKVIRCAVENAASVAVQFLITEVLISEMPD